MRWKALVGLALVMAAAAGCQQTWSLTESDTTHGISLALPPNLESMPGAGVVPDLPHAGPPATVVTPERPVRYLTLAEAQALALEHGTPGSRLHDGTTDDALVSLQGHDLGSAESPIRVLALNPAIARTDIEASLSKFDTLWNTSMTGQKIDEPIGGNFINSFNNGDLANLNT